jgi:hypothetical protein
VLGLLLDPVGKDLDKGEIGYPDYYLGEMDLEWLVERLLELQQR